MWVYYNETGTLTTKIPHGEVIRQGATFNITVAFSRDYFKEDIKKATGQDIMGLTLSEIKDWIDDNICATIEIPNMLFTEMKIFADVVYFKKIKSSEITFDLKEGHYIALKYVGDSVIAKEFGNFNAIIKLTYLNGTNKVSTLGVIPFTVERTYGWVNDDENESYRLPIASESTLGGIRVGDDFDIDGTGILSLAAKESDYKTMTKSGLEVPYIDGYYSTDVTLIKGLKPEDISVETYSVSGIKSNTFTYDPTTGNLNIQVVGVTGGSEIYAKITYRVLKSVIFEDFIDNYKEYELPVASHSILGGVKIGDDFEIDNNGLLSLKQGSNNNGIDEKEVVFWDDVKDDVQFYQSNEDSTCAYLDLSNVDLANKKLVIFFNSDTINDKPLWDYMADLVDIYSQDDFKTFIIKISSFNNTELKVIALYEYDQSYGITFVGSNTTISIEEAEGRLFNLGKVSGYLNSVSMQKDVYSRVDFYFNDNSSFYFKDVEEDIDVEIVSDREV